MNWVKMIKMREIKYQREDDEWRLEYITPISITSGNENITEMSKTVIMKGKELYTDISKTNYNLTILQKK